jgi:retron-type reverse transcriptase
VNTDVLWPDRELAEAQVLRIQIKLHQWAIDDPDRRFDDLFNLVCDPAVLVVAWARVRGNRGKRSAGVEGLGLSRSSPRRRCFYRGYEMISRLGCSLHFRCGNG